MLFNYLQMEEINRNFRLIKPISKLLDEMASKLFGKRGQSYVITAALLLLRSLNDEERQKLLISAMSIKAQSPEQVDDLLLKARAFNGYLASDKSTLIVDPSDNGNLADNVLPTLGNRDTSGKGSTNKATRR